MQIFCEQYGILSRDLTRKLQLRPAEEDLKYKEVFYHLGEMCWAFISAALQECKVENADETHFVFHLYSDHTLGFNGDEDLK